MAGTLEPKEAGKLHDFLMNPKSRPDLQTPDGQAFLRHLQSFYHNERTDALMPWLAREWKKGRVRIEPAYGDTASDEEIAELGGHRPDPRRDRPRPALQYMWMHPDEPDPNASAHAIYQLTPETLNHWADFYHSNHPLRREMPDIMREHVTPFHNRIDAWNQAMAQEAHEQALQGGQVVHTTPDNWTIRQLTAPEELEAEGDAMGHCVGGYGSSVATGRSLIYSLRDPQGVPHVTTEISPGYTESGQKNLNWLEVYLNEPPSDPMHRSLQVTPEVAAGLREYHKQRLEMQEGLRQKYDPEPLQWQGLYNELADQQVDGHRRDEFPLRAYPDNGDVVQIQGKGNREPIDEYKARMADWFRSFPLDRRPKSMHGDDETYLYDDEGYSHHQLDHPDLIPAYEREFGSLTPQTEPQEDEYGLIRMPGGQMEADYDDLLSKIASRSYGYYDQPDSTHIDDIYRLAYARGEIPDLAKALGGYQEEQQDNFDNWMDQNYEYAPRYPDPEDPHGWEDEDGFEGADETDEGAQPYWEPEGPAGQRYYDAAEAEKAYDDSYAEWERQHPGLSAVNQMYKHLRPHWGPHPDTGEQGYWNQIRSPEERGFQPNEQQLQVAQLPEGAQFLDPTGTQLTVIQAGEYPRTEDGPHTGRDVPSHIRLPQNPESPQTPQTFSKTASPIIPTKWDVLNQPRDEYVGEFPKFPGDREQFSISSPEYTEWVNAARPDIDAHRQREKDWDQAARNAMATGRMTPAQATDLGYRTQGNEGEGGWGAPKWGRWRPLPSQLYHVTTNVPAIAAEGRLRSPYELDQTGKARGLGSFGTDSTISLTDSREEAENIKRAMLEGADVASGRLPIERLVEMARTGEGAQQPWLKAMFGTHDWSKGNPRGLDDLLLGREPFYSHKLPEGHPLKERTGLKGPAGWGLRTADEWKQHGFYPYDDAQPMDHPNGPLYNEQSVYRYLSPEEKAHNAFEWWRNPWAPFRAYHAKGPPDPLFANSDPEWFANLDPSHVGIIQTQPVPGGHGYPMSSLGEWRIPTGEAVNITHINDEPYTAPQGVVQSAKPLYKRWVYSPATGQVELADNSGNPLDVRYHTDLARELNEPNLVHGYAYQIPSGWRLLDWENQPVEDPHVVAQVMGALRSSNGPSGPHEASWGPSEDADWQRVHHGLPS